jgi:hypothetical protein
MMSDTVRDHSVSRNGSHVVSPTAPNGETAAMIDAEVNEGGPPSPIPCDTPAERVPCPQRPGSSHDESVVMP